MEYPEWTDDEIDSEVLAAIKCLSDGTETEISGIVPVEKQLKFLENLDNEKKAKRHCCNKECAWEGFDTPDLRFCPACGWEIVGWKSEKYRQLQDS